MGLFRAAMFLVPLLAAASVRWWLARRDVRPAHRWLLWIPIAGSAVVAVKNQLPPRRRAAALVGGSAATYLALAGLSLVVFLTVGQSIGSRYGIGAVKPGAPAEGRLAPGDRLLRVDGVAIWFDQGPPLAGRIDAAGGRPVSIELERDGRAVTVEVAPQEDERGDYRIGVELTREPVFERPPFGRALADAAVTPATVSARFIAAWWDDVTGDHDDMALAGPVGILDTLNKVTHTGESLAMTLGVSVWFLTWAVLADLVLLLAVGFIAVRGRGSASVAR